MKEKIRRIKYFRLKPEERFLVDILNEMVEVKFDKFPDYVFYKCNDEIVFEYNSKNGNFYVNYDKIWSVFESKFRINYQEIINLIKGRVEEYTNLRGITPIPGALQMATRVEEYTNLRGITPLLIFNRKMIKVEEYTNLRGITPENDIIKSMAEVEEYTNLRGITPENDIIKSMAEVEEYTNLRGITPLFLLCICFQTVEEYTNLRGITPL